MSNGEAVLLLIGVAVIILLIITIIDHRRRKREEDERAIQAEEQYNADAIARTKEREADRVRYEGVAFDKAAKDVTAQDVLTAKASAAAKKKSKSKLGLPDVPPRSHHKK